MPTSTLPTCKIKKKKKTKQNIYVIENVGKVPTSAYIAISSPCYAVYSRTTLYTDIIMSKLAILFHFFCSL